MAVEISKDLAWQYKWHQEQINSHEVEMAKIRDLLAEVAGEDDTLTVNGAPVFTYAYVNRYQGTAFKKENPELAAEFTIEVTKEEIDWTKLKRLAPDMAKRYQSRSFKAL